MIRENNQRLGYTYLFTYDAWGNFISNAVGGTATEKQLALETPFRYRSYYFDKELQLYYLNSRYYDARLHRFINADSVAYLGANGDLQGFNLYAYCSNNPVMYYDPCGFVIQYNPPCSLELFKIYLLGDGSDKDFSNYSDFIYKIKTSKTMKNKINEYIEKYKMTGQSTFTEITVRFEAKDGLDLFLAIHKARFDITITETTHTEGWWIFKKTYTDYIVDIKIYDTYNFNGSEDADFLNKFGYYFEEKGYGQTYSWQATYKQTICTHPKKGRINFKSILILL